MGRVKLRKPLYRRLVWLIVFIVVIGGGLFTLLSFARASTDDSPQVEFTWGTSITNNIPIGADISPGAELLGGAPNVKTAIVISTYYSSKYLALRDITCESTVRCVSVSWPNFDNDPENGTYMPMTTPSGSSPTSIANFAYDHKFSICVNKPLPPPVLGAPSQRLYTPHFTVVGNSKRFVIQQLTRYYIGGDCDVNQGQTSVWYKTGPREHNWYICLNQTSPDGEGPYYDGVSRNSCFDQGVTVPTGNDTVTITGGLSGPKSSEKVAQQAGKSPTNAPQGGGGSSANIQGNAANTAPENNAQGENKPQKRDPSPFFDGREYRPGSIVVSANPTRQSKVVVYTWLYGLMAAVVLGAAGYWYRRRKR